MAEKSYFVSKNGQQMGPFKISEIVSKMKSNDLTSVDYIFDEAKNDWVLLLEFHELVSVLSAAKPKAAPPAKAANTEEKNDKPKAAAEAYMHYDWFVLKGENKFGPFAYSEMIKMLQEKIVFEFDFAWHAGLTTWMRIAEIDAFHVDAINQLKNNLMPEIKEVFFRRKNRRVEYNGTILVHDNNQVWKGFGCELSAGGAGVVMDNSLLVPGQTLYLHFKPCDGVPAFNAICEVVSKQYLKDVKDRKAPIRYGLKFKNINKNTQQFLQEYSSRAPEAA